MTTSCHYSYDFHFNFPESGDSFYYANGRQGGYYCFDVTTPEGKTYKLATNVSGMGLWLNTAHDMRQVEGLFDIEFPITRDGFRRKIRMYIENHAARLQGAY